VVPSSRGPVPRETGSSGRKGRRIAFAVGSAIFAAGAFGGLFGLGVLIGWFDTEDGGIHRVHMVGFGVLYGVILTVALVAMTRRPERKTSAFYQVVATAVAALVASLASADSRISPSASSSPSGLRSFWPSTRRGPRCFARRSTPAPSWVCSPWPDPSL
jgi:hypothetical protein